MTTSASNGRLERCNRRDLKRAFNHGCQCYICLEEIGEEDARYAKTGICGHAFHGKCIDAVEQPDSVLTKAVKGVFKHVSSSAGVALISKGGRIRILSAQEKRLLINTCLQEQEDYVNRYEKAWGPHCPVCKREGMFVHRAAGNVFTRQTQIGTSDMYLKLANFFEHARDAGTPSEMEMICTMKMAFREFRDTAYKMFKDEDDRGPGWMDPPRLYPHKHMRVKLVCLDDTRRPADDPMGNDILELYERGQLH